MPCNCRKEGDIHGYNYQEIINIMIHADYHLRPDINIISNYFDTRYCEIKQI